MVIFKIFDTAWHGSSTSMMMDVAQPVLAVGAGNCADRNPVENAGLLCNVRNLDPTS